jgi:P pilus assembly chaperone PapD
MLRRVLKVIIMMTLGLSYQAHAIAVSSLFEVADVKTHSADIQVINNDGKDMFINLSMAKVRYVDGKKIVENLNKDNVADWKFNVSPAQMILKPGERKIIRMFNDCDLDCKFSEDQVYAVSITPVPYTNGKKSAVAVAFGYKVYFIDPASEVLVDYDLKRISEDKISFENRSNTMLNAVLSLCTKDFSSDCIYEYRLLPNSKREFRLPAESHKKSKIDFSVINANEVVHERVSI